ncbi:hypothetical protein BCR34DRAFT_667306 [Clohesyomyces aquaticus]|uniref:Uncharacterized protein n=1 Tax=Clohesyomyces aquaticus TaxID=1231657 RepID=A0A1Y1Z153_9PLEO|nr:hypothetical protein BCR34DRAFT_667306 [Clohesyomyces aquaticus]
MEYAYDKYAYDKYAHKKYASGPLTHLGTVCHYFISIVAFLLFLPFEILFALLNAFGHTFGSTILSIILGLAVLCYNILKLPNGEEKVKMIETLEFPPFTEILDYMLKSIQPTPFQEGACLVTDNELDKLFRHLNNAVRSLSHEILGHELYPRALSGLFNSRALVKGLPKSFWDGDQIRPGVFRCDALQGALWSVLLKTIFSHPFSVFGERAGNLAWEWGLPNRNKEAEIWRSLTFNSLLRKAGVADEQYSLNSPVHDILHGKAEIDQAVLPVHFRDELSAEARSSIHLARDHFVKTVRTFVLRLGRTAAHDHAVLSKIDSVITASQLLALKIGRGIPRVEFAFPQAGTLTVDIEFHGPSPRYEASGGSSNTTGSVAFTVSPGLRKWGNQRGGFLDEALHIAPPVVHIKGDESFVSGVMAQGH